MIGLTAYCSMFERRVIQNPVRALSIAVLFLLMMGVARALYLSDVAVRYPFIVVGNVIITAAILTMVYSQRFAIGMTVGLALAKPGDFEVFQICHSPDGSTTRSAHGSDLGLGVA